MFELALASLERPGPMVLDSIRCSDANIEILQKQKFQR